jgi:hypothetical protein
MRNAFFWTIWFALIAGLAVVYLFSNDHSTLTVLGLPTWLWYFFLIEVLFAFSIWVFCSRFWQDENPERS